MLNEIIQTQEKCFLSEVEFRREKRCMKLKGGLLRMCNRKRGRWKGRGKENNRWGEYDQSILHVCMEILE
jgi:hypothetical protein